MREKGSAAYQLFLLCLSIYVLVIIFADTFYIENPEIKLVLQYIDLSICLVFLFDFFLNLYTAEDKKEYMRWGWLDLISSIPMLDPLRWGRLAKIIRIFRFLRTIKSLKILIHTIHKSKYQSFSLVIFLITFVIFTLCASVILDFEAETASQIKTASDALWWAFLNIMNAKIAVTQAQSYAGQITTIVLNKLGLVLFAYFNAMMIAWLVQRRVSFVDSEQSAS